MIELTEKINDLLGPLLDGTDIFMVGVKIKPTNNIKIYLDAESGFSIDKCTSINRRLYAKIEEEQWFPGGDFLLEVSSPGIDEPLGGVRQYKKNAGRTVTVTNMEGKEQTGIMKEVTDTHIVLEIKPIKAKDAAVTTEIPFTDIKKTVVQVIF